MENRYSRNFPALSLKEQKILKDKKAFIAGAGGLGGYLLEFMLRLGAGEIKICDGDSFSLSNLNRQLLSETGNIGFSKLKAAKDRAAKINPDVTFIPAEEYINKENALSLIKGYDVVLDGLDNPESRKILFSACEKLGIPYIYGAVSGFTAQAAVLLPGSRLLEELYPESFKAADSGILSFTPAIAAAMQCALCIKLLCREATESGHLYCADLFNMDFENFLFD